MPTKRENLEALLAGETPQWTPASINFGQWYAHHTSFGTLPDELAGTSDLVDAMKVLGCDIFSRNIDGGYRQQAIDVDQETIESAGDLGPRRTTRIRTPHGTLEAIVELQPQQSTSYQVKDLVTDWSSERAAYLHLLERERCDWDAEAFAATDAKVGDDGLVLVTAGSTPLKVLHGHFGLDGACMFIVDEPDDAKVVADLYWRALWPALVKIAEAPAPRAAILMDNVDTPFYPPSFAEMFWTPYVREAADLFAQHGKRLFVHACGKLHDLIPQFIASGVHGLEGMAHPPLGDWTIADAKAMPAPFIYNGGFGAHEQVTKTDDQLRDHYARFFGELAGHERFIFAAACQTTVHTPWERIKLAMELCREYRGSPV